MRAKIKAKSLLFTRFSENDQAANLINVFAQHYLRKFCVHRKLERLFYQVLIHGRCGSCVSILGYEF